MRKGILVTFLSLLSLVLLAAPAVADFGATVSISSFHDTLAPHGRWVVTRSYGEVWVPSGIEAGWQPYWNGEWVWSDYGWTWVSYDPWGDIPFHYGTWTWVDGEGWVWIPGTVWAPAWVTWAWTDDCIGWAPVPATFAFAAGGYFGSPVVLPASRYVFVPAGQFVGDPIRSARVPLSRNATLLASARTATRFNVSGGIVRTTADPPPSFVQRATGKRLQRVSLSRVRTRPTTVAAAGHTGRIGVVAPARERAAALSRTANARTTTASSSANARRSNERAAAPTSVRHGARSSSHAPVRVEKNPRTGSRTVTNTRSTGGSRAIAKSRPANTSTERVVRPSSRTGTTSSVERSPVRPSNHARSAGSVEKSASRTRSAPARETARKAETHASTPETRASSAHAAPAHASSPPAQARPEHQAHAVAHSAPAGPPAARQSPPPRQPKQHPPKSKDQERP